MRALVTGSGGHLGEALVRTLKDSEHDVTGVDMRPSPSTSEVGSIVDRQFVKRCMNGMQVVFHAAALHKPHIGTHSRREFVDVNTTGTLNLLEEAKAAGVSAFIFTSSTSVFGDALVPPADAPAAWISEEVTPIPKNIYGVTKAAGEDLCQLFHRNHGLPCLVLRTSRFFPEEDDDEFTRTSYISDNVKANEFLFRRVDIEDVVGAHMLAAKRAPAIGFRRYIVSATTPFLPTDVAELRTDAPAVVRRRAVDYEAEYVSRGWKMFQSIDRVYINDRARKELGWQPRYDFDYIIDRLQAGDGPQSPLARLIGVKGYHAVRFAGRPYPTE
jgi:UDP-glucose 4-epimerase